MRCSALVSAQHMDGCSSACRNAIVEGGCMPPLVALLAGHNHLFTTSSVHPIFQQRGASAHNFCYPVPGSGYYCLFETAVSTHPKRPTAVGHTD